MVDSEDYAGRLRPFRWPLSQWGPLDQEPRDTLMFPPEVAQLHHSTGHAEHPPRRKREVCKHRRTGAPVRSQRR